MRTEPEFPICRWLAKSIQSQWTCVIFNSRHFITLGGLEFVRSVKLTCGELGPLYAFFGTSDNQVRIHYITFVLRMVRI